MSEETQTALPGPYAASPAVAQPAVANLVRSQVKALLMSAPSFTRLSPDDQRLLANNLVKVASYNAELVRDQWLQAEKLNQVPMLRRTTASALAEKAPEKTGPVADEFSPRAVSQAGKLTKDTLDAIAFPTFVADLIKGTFRAIVEASIQQMEAYVKLLENVAKTVDQFMAENITDNQARDYLVQNHPETLKLEHGDRGATLKVVDTGDEHAPPDLKALYQLPEDFQLDDDNAEQKLVPAARRRLAESRHQMLSTMVLMGINRIVVTSGSLKATMGFHLEAKDTGTAESASQYDYKRNSTSFAGGSFLGMFGGFNATQTSVAYVSTQKRGTTDDIKLNTDLTAALDLKFKSDYFPLERFAKTGVIAQIQSNTANPQANAPATQSAAVKE